MKALCLYSSFVTGNDIPFYVRYYLQQLRPHFTKLVYITNERSMTEEAKSFLEHEKIDLMFVQNEGYDFGMWGKALDVEGAVGWNRIALVNDSCILFKPLDEDFRRINASNADYVGMIISDRYATHLQSFFLVINERAIPVMMEHFKEHGLIADYRELIQRYEIGLSQKMINKGMHVMSLYGNEFRSFPKNPSFALVRELIQEGIPLIKKKIVFRNYRGLEYYWVVRMNFDTDYRKYFKMIRQKYADACIDLDKVMIDAPKKGHGDILLFATARAVANVLRSIPGIRWLFHRLVDLYKRYFR
ncbi:MAG: rhamnan synthesis F family protein [Flavobacteriales bacterium]|nr:rhamnan synthesis F family protein [Flavobacteriales bacterium]